jgi:hypothetical protein
MGSPSASSPHDEEVVQVSSLEPAFFRVHAAHHLGAVIGQRLLGMERPGLAGQPLHENLGVFVDEDRHYFFLAWRRKPVSS